MFHLQKHLYISFISLFVGDKEKAQIIRKLLRKGKIGNSYDRIEFFKRYNIQDIEELIKIGILISPKKKEFRTLSVNPEKLREAVTFVKIHIPEFKEMMDSQFPQFKD